MALHPLQNQGLLVLSISGQSWKLAWPSRLLPALLFPFTHLHDNSTSFTSSRVPPITSLTRQHPQALGCLPLTALTRADILFGWHLNLAWRFIWSASSFTRTENMNFYTLLYPLCLAWCPLATGGQEALKYVLNGWTEITLKKKFKWLIWE